MRMDGFYYGRLRKGEGVRANKKARVRLSESENMRS